MSAEHSISLAADLVKPLACEHEGCDSTDIIECYLPDGEFHAYCFVHAGPAGFCQYCGSFWGGVESFEFIHPNVCDDCQTEMELNDVYDADDDLDDSDIGEGEDWY